MFTAGIGENSAEIRRRICESSAWLGVELDARGQHPRRGLGISTPESKVSAWVIPTNEELMIARHTGSAARIGRGPRIDTKERRITMAATALHRNSQRKLLSAWQGFQTGLWQKEINVRDFIQQNYQPYEGDESFLAVRNRAHEEIWDRLNELFVEERRKGVFDVSQIPSSITAHGPGYIDRENEIIVGLQTDAPLKRAIMPNGGLRMVVTCSQDYGYEPDPHVVETFSKYRKTHNDGVFDAYTAGHQTVPELSHPDRTARRLRARPDHR